MARPKYGKKAEGNYIFKLEDFHIVEMRNGHHATVEFWNGKPSRFVTTAYIKKFSSYCDDLTFYSRVPNDVYDVMKVLDGSEIDDVDSVFNRNFDFEKLPVLWEREK